MVVGVVLSCCKLGVVSLITINQIFRKFFLLGIFLISGLIFFEGLAKEEHRFFSRQISSFLLSSFFTVFAADHGFGTHEYHSIDDELKLTVHHRRPDFVVRINQQIYCIEIKTKNVLADRRLIAQLRAFEEAGYKTILVLRSKDLQSTRRALQFVDCPKPYAIFDLQGFKAWLHDQEIAYNEDR